MSTTTWNPRTARQVRRSIEDLFDRRVSQEELAKWLGYSRTTVQGWETGRYTPDPAVRFIYHKLVFDPGFITEVQQWSCDNDAGQHQTSEAPAGQ